MNAELRKVLETTLEQTIYGIVEKFLIDVLPTRQDTNEIQKEQILNRVSEHIKNEVPQIITKLEQQGITSSTDFEEKSDIVIAFVDEIQKKMIEDAKRLSE